MTGSLRQISALQKDGTLAAGTYNKAFQFAKKIHDDIPANWMPYLTLDNPGHQYQLLDPTKVPGLPPPQ